MTDASEDPNATVVKMRLRPQPRPVLRLSRKMLMAVGAVGAIAVGGALTFAMLPSSPAKSEANTKAEVPTHNHPASEALNALPKDYTSVTQMGVPQLGPPLPGDLGRPLLAAQASGMVSADSASTGAGTTSSQTVTSPGAQARVAARTSQLFFAASNPQPMSVAATDVADKAGALDGQLASLSAWAPSTTATAVAKSEPERKRAFLAQATDQSVISEQRLIAPASPYILLAGSVVPAALITGVSSDIPGQVLAQITQDVRDSISGRYLLIPKGSRLIGQYDNTVSIGQTRVLLKWSRLIVPSGKSLLLEDLGGADAQGLAGLKDRTNNHWSGVVGAAAVSTLLAIGAQAGDSDGSDLIRALQDGASDSINRAGQRIVERQVSIQPTLTIRPGLPLRVILTKDLVLEPYGD